MLKAAVPLRSRRRHELARLKDRMRLIAERVWCTEARWLNDEFIGKMASTHGAACSCWGCGNQRPYEGPSVAERRRAQDLHEE